MKLLEAFRPRSFGMRVFIFVQPIIVVFSVFVIILGSRERQKQSFEVAADKARSIARMTVFSLGPPLFFEDPSAIDEVVQSAKQNKDLAYLVVLDASGREVAQFNGALAPDSKSAPDAAQETGYFSSGKETFHIAAPVVVKDRPAGRLLLGLSLREAIRETAIYRSKLMLLGLGLLLSGMAAVYFLSMAITKPLGRVSGIALEIARGDLTLRAPVSSRDESGRLAAAFNTMVDALADSRATLENRVEQRTRELQTEVAERRRAEVALRESEENFRSMVENLGEGIGLISEDESFLFANRTAAEIFGVPEAGFAGRNLGEFLSPEAFAVVRRQTELRKKGERSSYELELRRPDGSIRTIMLNAIPRLGPDGKFIGALSVFTDITGRNAAEREIREANEKLRATVLELERRNTQIALLSELYEAFQACRKADEIFETAARYALKLFPGAAGTLYIFKESRNLLEALAAWGPGERAADVIVPDDCWALRRGKAHLADSPDSSPICPHVKSDNGAPPYACVPLSARGETLGLLHIRFLDASGSGGMPGGRAGLGPVQSLAERIALALDNFRLREKLLQQSIRDPLTGLFNRRFMEETLARELARVERNGLSLGVIMLDIDKFKNFNDTFGHEAGDEMLKVIGAFLPTQVRREDVVCRYGGEEFTIILPGASLEASAERARKVLEAVRALRVKHDRDVLGPVTLSMGVAAFPRHGSTGLAIMKAADMALLRAKKEGRDRVVVTE